MKTNLKTMLQLLLQSPRRFPVEAALGVAFFIIGVWDSETTAWNEVTRQIDSSINGDILWLFVPLVVLSFWLQRVNRWAYYASFFLFLPLMALNLRPFLWTYGFYFTYVLAAILLIVGSKRMDNRPFAAHALHVVTQMFFGLLITVILNLAVMAIVASFFYIFGIREPNNIYKYIAQFIWFVLAPQICCTFVRQHEDEVNEPPKVLQLILNFILSPAVIIYTVILYTYFAKIVFEWDLPKGGVAWMVMGFVTVALAGRLMQYVLNEHHYDWFYRRFTWIAIPPLIMYWVGSIYRIRLYSFTESRFYLMVAGVLMTLFVLMLLWRRTRWFQLMALIFGAAVIVFTYIPGISAKSIGFACQKARLHQYIHDLKLVDAKTHKFVQTLDVDAIRSDSVRSAQYQEVCSIIDYVRKDMGRDAFAEQYGKWSWYDSEFEDSQTDYVRADSVCKTPVNLGDYNVMLHSGDFNFVQQDGTITLMRDNKVVLVYPINDRVRRNPQLLDQSDSLFTWRNDSLMLVLQAFNVDANGMVRAQPFNYKVFRKPR